MKSYIKRKMVSTVNKKSWEKREKENPKLIYKRKDKLQ
jgi:hypothetical protein